MKNLAILTLLIGITACSKHPDSESTQSLDPKKVYGTDSGRVIVLTVHEASSSIHLKSMLGEELGKAEWSPQDNSCTITYKKGDHKTAGHELQHCIDGSFHK